MSENHLYNVIEKEYSTSELTNTSNFTGMGDMILKRKDKIPILIEQILLLFQFFFIGCFFIRILNEPIISSPNPKTGCGNEMPFLFFMINY